MVSCRRTALRGSSRTYPRSVSNGMGGAVRAQWAYCLYEIRKAVVAMFSRLTVGRRGRRDKGRQLLSWATPPK